MNSLCPLVSIVVPFYNQKSAYLIESLSSALSQTYPRIEVIAVNNQSTNGCDYVAKILASEYQNIILLNAPKHLPMVQSFEYAISHAQGDYIVVLCSDDVLDSDHVSKLVSPIINDPTISLSCSLPFQHIDKFASRPDSPISAGKYSSLDFLRHVLGFLFVH